MTAPFQQQEDVRVLVVSEDPLARGGLAGLLGAEAGVSLAGQVPPSPASLANAPGHDVRAWDLGIDASAGLERLRAVDRASAPVVALVASDEGAFEALAAGARGAISRDADGPRLVAALRATAQGFVVVDDAWAPTLLQRPASPPPNGLSPREQEVLHLLAEGHANKIIADRLGISDHTAKFHVNSIFAKLEATTRTEAVVRALRRGWLTL